MIGRRVRGALAVAVLAAAGSAQPATGAEGTATLVLRARASAYVDVTFPTAFRLHDATTSAPGASFSGYYLQPLKGPAENGFGQVWLSGFRHPGYAEAPIPIGGPGTNPELPDPGQDWSIPAGRYRVHVLGDRPTVARLRVSGQVPLRSATAARRSGAYAAWRTLTLPAAEQPAPAVVALGEIPIPVRPRSMAFSSLFFARRGTHTNVATASTCIGKADGVRCVRGAQYSHARSYQEIETDFVLAEGVGTVTTYYATGALPPGENVGYFEHAATWMIDKAVGAVFTLPL